MKSELSEQQLRVKIIGEFLKKHRTKAGLTQHEVAIALGYDVAQFVSNWERGVSLPPIAVLPKLAVMYKVSGQAFIDMMIEYQETMLKRQKRHIQQLFANHKRK